MEGKYFRILSEEDMKTIHDSSLRILGRTGMLIDHKGARDLLQEAGAEVVSVDPRHTSQVCSCCGSMVRKTLSVRVHQCPDCGLEIDRDVNAAVNVLNRMLSARTERWGVNVVGCDKRSPRSSLL